MKILQGGKQIERHTYATLGTASFQHGLEVCTVCVCVCVCVAGPSGHAV
jgi:hypothetical protein